MIKPKPFELYTLRALAAIEGMSYSNLKKIMMETVKTVPITWRNWKFVSIGPEQKKVWLAYKDTREITIYNDIEDVSHKLGESQAHEQA